ncbi:MAG: DNA adenine methylase [Candidatus Acidiferrales bacterium]
MDKTKKHAPPWGKSPDGTEIYVVMSAAHKAMRDGDEAAAVYWIKQLYFSRYKVWKQLMIWAAEDIGVADLSVAKILVTLAQAAAHCEKDGKASDLLHIVLGTVICCRAKKSRAADNAILWFNENPTWRPPEWTAENAKTLEDAARKYLNDFPQPAIPEKVFDKHTARGQNAGRKDEAGLEHFKNEAAVLTNESDVAPWQPPSIDLVAMPLESTDATAEALSPEPEPPEPGPPRRKKAQAASSTRIPTFGYPGGKARLARRIAAMLPTSGKRYLEVFAGRANVYFAVAELLAYDQFWLNDPVRYLFLNSLKTGLWRNAKIPECTRANYEKYREAAKGWMLDGDRVWAVRFPSPHLLEQYLCYSGGTYYNGSRGKNAHLAFSGRGFENRVRLASSIMQRTQLRITRTDYRDVLSQCGEGDVVYLDPPYIGCDVDAYSDKSLDHREMVEILLKAKFKWVLSEYEQPLYIKAFGQPLRINVHKLLGPKGASNLRAIECLWRNF